MDCPSANSVIKPFGLRLDTTADPLLLYAYKINKAVVHGLVRSVVLLLSIYKKNRRQSECTSKGRVPHLSYILAIYITITITSV